MKAQQIGSATNLQQADWDALDDQDNPFVKHAFLRLLESSGSVGEGTGWEPRFVGVYDGTTLVGGAPAYRRTDSYGEYVFDWGWAQAAQRAGIRYYPKITVAVPFTPANGPRLLVRPGADPVRVRQALLDGLLQLCRDERASGLHVLLCSDEEASFLASHGCLQRLTHQYHFHNPGYASYDAFLDALRSEARKQLRKERRRVLEQGIDIERRRGDTLSDEEWATVNALYLETSSKKWGRPYLTREFFAQAKAAVGESALVCFGRREGEIIAMSLSFEKGRHLYGRYWGSSEDVDGLHFELCYHQLIAHAIANGHTLVEAGAQGEHKVKRGFEPAITHSAHLLFHAGLHDAVARAVAEESEALTDALPQMTTPFRR